MSDYQKEKNMPENCMNKSSVKISVIIPVYNVEAYLKECLDSFLNQELKEIEVICVNDGSTDNSLNVLKEYQQKDSRVIVINQENKGQGEARNVGIDASRGEYLFFADPDDYIEENSLSKLYSYARENNSNIVWFNYKIVHEYSGETKEYIFPNYLLAEKDDPKDFEKIAIKNIKKNFYIFGGAVWNRICQKQ